VFPVRSRCSSPTPFHNSLHVGVQQIVPEGLFVIEKTPLYA
jgi:hypothetical protein